MSACERYWSNAYLRARRLGGMQAEHYRDLLAEHPTGHDDPSPPTRPEPEDPMTESLTREHRAVLDTHLAPDPHQPTLED